MEIQSFEEWSATVMLKLLSISWLRLFRRMTVKLLKPWYRKQTNKTRYGLMRQL